MEKYQIILDEMEKELTRLEKEKNIAIAEKVKAEKIYSNIVNFGEPSEDFEYNFCPNRTLETIRIEMDKYNIIRIGFLSKETKYKEVRKSSLKDGGILFLGILLMLLLIMLITGVFASSLVFHLIGIAIVSSLVLSSMSGLCLFWQNTKEIRNLLKNHTLEEVETKLSELLEEEKAVFAKIKPAEEMLDVKTKELEGKIALIEEQKRKISLVKKIINNMVQEFMASKLTEEQKNSFDESVSSAITRTLEIK